MNFLIITLVFLITQSIASDEAEKSVESRDAVEDTQNEPAQLLRDASDDSELEKAATSQESRFDRASGSDDDLAERAAEENLEAKSALVEDIVKTVESRSADNIEKSADPAASFLRESDDLEKTGEVSISKSAEDDANLERMPKQDESERSAEDALESEERTVQYDEIKDGAKDLRFLKNRRMFGDDFLDLKARSGRVEEHLNDNLKSALDNMKLAQNFNPLDSRSTFSQLTPVVNKQVYRSFYTVQPPQVFQFSSHEKPSVMFPNLLPNKRSFDVSRELGSQLKRVNLFTSSEHIRNAYPFQPHTMTTQKTNLPFHVNDILSKFTKPTDALSNFNADFSQRSMLLGQPFMPLPLLHQRFPRLIPIRNTLRPFFTK